MDNRLNDASRSGDGQIWRHLAINRVIYFIVQRLILFFYCFNLRFTKLDLCTPGVLFVLATRLSELKRTFSSAAVVTNKTDMYC